MKKTKVIPVLQSEIEQNRELWAKTAKQNGWYKEPFYVQLWVDAAGNISDSVSYRTLDRDVVVNNETDTELDSQQYKIVTKKKEQPVQVLSPDGVTIDFEHWTYPTMAAAVEAFNKWKARYEKQGYYSYNMQRIPLENLQDRCSFNRIAK